MKNRWLILAGILLTGCASQQPAMQTVTIAPEPQASAAALVFDAPITLDQPSINLSRSNRGQAAFVGFDQTSVTYYDIITDNRQTTDCSDQFVRESVTERVGVTSR